MSKRVLILVEGQTEEQFVNKVLAPHFSPMDLYIYPTLLVTKRVKDGPNFKGGVSNFAKFENDLKRLMYKSGDALITTMLDYYRLPSDFPGMNARPSGVPEQRVIHVEDEVYRHFRSPKNLSIFLALHEFEAWLFSSTKVLPRVMTERDKESAFAAIRNEFSSPEEINERPGFAPSNRILNLFPTYRKTFHGPTAAGRIGLDKIREECPHFNTWIEKMENFAQTAPLHK